MSKKQESDKDLEAESQCKESASLDRRQFTKAGLLASPILMSVVSQPVFGVGCLSNILSGNLSDPDRGTCNLGKSPGYWKNHPDAWPMGNASYMPDGTTVPAGCSNCKEKGEWICINGPRFNTYFPSGPDRSMHEMICTMSGSDEFHIIAALLNAMSDPNYVLSVAQVKELWEDKTLGGAIGNFRSFLDSTWT